jgi:integrase
MREKVAPFLRGRVYWARIPRLEAPAVQRSLATESHDVALEMCAFLRWLRGRRESYLLDALATGKAAVGSAFSAYLENRLEAFITDLREGLRDTDLEPFVAMWIREMERRKKPNADTRRRYLRQVRTLLVAGKPFPRSQFTKQRIRDWLREIGVGQPNRYRAALSSFAEFLLFDDVLPLNPVRQVPSSAEREPRTLHLSVPDAMRLLDVLEGPYKALHALMLATAMEVSAALAVRRGDLNFEDGTGFARGTKRASRTRTCTVTATWEGAWAHVIEYCRQNPGLPDSRPFAGISSTMSYRALKQGLAAKGMDPAYTQHDHRHTWAVQAVREGLALHTVAHQLGHRDATMVLKVYGRFMPSASDFRPKTPPIATTSATATKAAKVAE